LVPNQVSNIQQKLFRLSKAIKLLTRDCQGVSAKRM